LRVLYPGREQFLSFVCLFSKKNYLHFNTLSADTGRARKVYNSREQYMYCTLSQKHLQFMKSFQNYLVILRRAKLVLETIHGSFGNIDRPNFSR
jgi:hypothetical protein